MKCNVCGKTIRKEGDYSGDYYRIAALSRITAYVHEECFPSLGDILDAAERSGYTDEGSKLFAELERMRG